MFVTYVIDDNNYTENQITDAMVETGGLADTIDQKDFADYAKADFPEFFHIKVDETGAVNVTIQKEDLRKEVNKRIDKVIQYAERLKADIARDNGSAEKSEASAAANDNYGFKIFEDDGTFSDKPVPTKTGDPAGIYILSTMVSDLYGPQIFSDYGSFSLNNWMYSALVFADRDKKKEIRFTIYQAFECGQL